MPDYSKADWASMKRHLSSLAVEFEEESESLSAEQCMDSLETAIRTAVNDFIPKKNK